MKKTIYSAVFLSLFFFCLQSSNAQYTTYTYPLSASFNGLEAGAPPLTQIPNNNSLTGEFVARSVPVTTCEQGGIAKGYFFEDDAGLQFDNPEGFIDAGIYSLSMIFHFDEFIEPPPWVRILSFTHEDDYGIYIYLSNAPLTGTLDFWPHGTVGTPDFFNTDDYYQLILVRDETGLVTVYINGEEFADYDDSSTEEYLPQPDKDYLKFFRDHPSVMANEASPGFVSNIVITNRAWTPTQVTARWDLFCGSLLYTEELSLDKIKIFPIPADDRLTIELQNNQSVLQFSVFDITGKQIIQTSSSEEETNIDISALNAGLYILKIDMDRETQMVKFTKK